MSDMFKHKEWWAKNVAFVIDLTIIGVWASMTIYIIAHQFGIIKAEHTADYSGVLGVYAGVTGLATQVVSFHRGSSKGSEDKSKQISDMVATKEAPKEEVK